MAGYEFHVGDSTYPRPTKASGPQDWEAKRERIAWYYIQENFTLDKLQTTMAQRHGFNAT